eukprot:PITA_24912
MKDLGFMHYFLGMDIWQGDGESFVSQGKYANEILRRFHMESCKPMEYPLDDNWRKKDAALGEVVEATVYKHLVGSLMKKRSVSFSPVEAEYMAVSQETCEAIWMRKSLFGLFGQQMDPTVIYCDNQSLIKLFENPVFHDRSKHIDIQYHHLRDCVLR